MPNFNIVKKSNIDETYRVARVMGDYDVKIEHANEHFVGTIDLPDEWSIGAIVGGSGTGKTTIAKELFSDVLFTGHKYKAKSVIDDMPENKTMNEIEKMFYSVGFGSVPSWLKPYDVLSNGEKMRVDMAYALLENDFVVFDEFTSVVDRNVAQVASLAISKAVRKLDKKFVAVTCHFDILEWLQPDWIFNTDTMQMSFQFAHGNRNNSLSKNVGVKNGESLGVITI